MNNKFFCTSWNFNSTILALSDILHFNETLQEWSESGIWNYFYQWKNIILELICPYEPVYVGECEGLSDSLSDNNTCIIASKGNSTSYNCICQCAFYI